MMQLLYAIAYEGGFQRWLRKSRVSACNIELARKWYAVNRLRYRA